MSARGGAPVSCGDGGVLDVGAAGARRDVVKGPRLVARRRDHEFARGVHRDARHVPCVILERVSRSACRGIPDLDSLVRRR